MSDRLNDRRQARAERAQDMYQAYLRGMSLAEVGALYGLGPERVRQLFFMTRLPTRKKAWRPPDHPDRARASSPTIRGERRPSRPRTVGAESP